MSLSTELLIGIILIGMGLLLGTAAYMVLSSRKDDSDEELEDQEDVLGDELEDELEEAVPAVEQDDEIVPEEEGEDSLISVDASPEGHPTPDLPIAFDSSDEDELEPQGSDVESKDIEFIEASVAAEPAISSPEPASGPRIQVASLLRDEVSGELIVQVGDREYRNADELRDSGDWTRVEFAAADLTKWIDQPIVRPVPEREVEVVDRAKPMSMIEQINEILQGKIEASGKSHLAVRLIEGTEGSARVLIGVHSYELGEVPDESISNLIREAVADWEAGS
jgi:hypothetical protein